jgi:uncharacterized membrane protein YfcA
MEWKALAVFIVSMIASALSGMAGGGGGFIINPFYILLGLTPQQTVATGKFGSFGLSLGAITAFRRHLFEDKKFSLFMIVLSAVIGVISAVSLKSIDNVLLQRLMGAFMLASIPMMLKKTAGSRHAQKSSLVMATGAILMAIVLLLQGLLGGGVGALVSVVMVVFFGKTALEGNIMKRKTSIVLNIVIVASLFTSGLINFTYGFAAMAGGLIGGYMGSMTALKKGDEFALKTMIIFMLVSGIWLIAAA